VSLRRGSRAQIGPDWMSRLPRQGYQCLGRLRRYRRGRGVVCRVRMCHGSVCTACRCHASRCLRPEYLSRPYRVGLCPGRLRCVGACPGSGCPDCRCPDCV
jgi:hypothetical protein